MSGDILDVDISILFNEECGDEVGYPDVQLVSLYSNQDESCFYYVDSNTKEILNEFTIKKEGNHE